MARRTVNGSVADLFTDGPAAGVTVTLSAMPRRWTDEAGDRVLAAPDHAVTVTNGSWSVSLLPTDEPGIEPATGRYYRLVETVNGVPIRRRVFEVPAGVGDLDIDDLVIADPGLPGYVRGATGATGAAGPPGPPGADGSNADAEAYTDAALVAEVARANAAYETPAGATSKVTAHTNATDPHGDRADAAGKFLRKDQNLADLESAPAARTALGLGTAATKNRPAWQFDVTEYGALGNGMTVADGAMTSGSAVLTCAASVPFAVGDVGKRVLVLGAGASGETLSATISAFTDSGHVTLNATAGTSVSSACAMWSSDDTAAIQAAIDAAGTYAAAHSGSATVLIPPAPGRFYGVGGALRTGGSTLGNAQLTLPVYPATGRKISLTIQGTSSGAGVQHWQQTLPNTTGSTLLSFGLFASAPAQTASINAAGNPCVLGGPSQPGGYAVAPGVFSNMYVDLDNVSILTAHSKFGLTYSAIDFSGIANARLKDVQYSTCGTVPGGSYVSPGVFATGLSIGCLLPANGNNDLTMIENVTCGGGYTYAMLVPEHTDIYGLRLLYCWAALCPVGSYYSSVGAAHSIRASLISIEQCTFLVYIFGPGTGGLGPTMDLRIDTETSTPRFGCRTSGTGLAAARGRVVIAGLFTPSGLTLDYPTGLHIENAQLTYPITSKTGNYTAGSFDEVVTVDATSGPVTITLPTAVGRTRPVTVKKVDASGNSVTIDGAGSETIDGQLTRVLAAQWRSATLVPSGSGWVTQSVIGVDPDAAAASAVAALSALTQTVVKAVDETRTSTTTVADDGHLFAALDANSVYRFRGTLLFDGPEAADASLTFTVPSGATGGWAPNAGTLGTTVPDGSAQVKVAARLFGSNSDIGVMASSASLAGIMATPQGIVTTGATPGLLRLRWAQQTTNASPVALKAGSTLEVVKVSGAGPAASGISLDNPARLPSDQGLLAWTGDPNDAGHVTAQSNAGVAGRITLVQLLLRKQISWSKIWFGLAGVDGSASLSNCYLGVYDSSGALKGVTADISSALLTSPVGKSVDLVTQFTAPPGEYYIAMLLGNGSTWATNSLTFKATGAGITVNCGLSAPRLRYSNMLTGQTSLPASLDLTQQSTSIINTGWASQWYGVS
ncbi:hypothetical protein ACFWNQ_25190 [Streptomyces virginiae]|uniref:hypothetical protein n=1 Tax=Streptomyces virginiae TaxID=1961 RepID=UPI00364BCA99